MGRRRPSAVAAQFHMKKSFAFLLLAAVLVVVVSLTAAPPELTLLPTVNGPHVFARTKPGHVDARVLAASTVETNAVPSGARFVFFAATGNFFARPDGTVTVPSSDVTDGTAGEVNPTVWDVSTVTNIMVIAPSACTVTLSFYK